MSGKPSKQLGALLNRVPAATASGQGQGPTSRSAPVAYAPEPSAPVAVPPKSLPDDGAEEVPFQVLIPKHVRIQLDRRHAETRKSLRILALEALRADGYHVTDDDLAGKRGRKKS
jgi:hypothetical protein